MAGERLDCEQNYHAGMTLEDGLCKYLLLEKGEGGLRVRKNICMPVTACNDAEHETSFRALSEQGDLREVPISFALRFNESLIKIIDLPGYSLQEARAAVRYQFEDYFPFTYEESRFDIDEVKNSAAEATEKQFAAAVSRARVVETIEDGAAKYGFTLANVEPAQLAFERAVTPELGAEHLIAIYAGFKDLSLILSDSGNGLFYRNTVVRAEGAQYYDKAAAEAKAFLDFTMSKIPLFESGRVIVAGPNASESLCAAIARELDVANVETVNLFAQFGMMQDNWCTVSESLLPLGAALGQI